MELSWVEGRNVKFIVRDQFVLALKSWELVPTDPFTTLEPHNQVIGELCVVQERCMTDYEGRLGYVIGGAICYQP